MKLFKTFFIPNYSLQEIFVLLLMCFTKSFLTNSDVILVYFFSCCKFRCVCSLMRFYRIMQLFFLFLYTLKNDEGSKYYKCSIPMIIQYKNIISLLKIKSLYYIYMINTKFLWFYKHLWLDPVFIWNSFIIFHLKTQYTIPK